MIKSSMRRLQRLEKKMQRPKVIFRFHLQDGRVVDCERRELGELSHRDSDDAYTFFDASEADLNL
jgi:hypothetical protein